MTRNLGRVDQFFRIVIGLAFVAFALRDGFPGVEDVAAAAIGMVLLLTAFFSYCPLYSLLGVSTCRKTDQAT
ncbi:YgaP family membrane protein [Bradyrhizobium sp.]|uniref:YgaP family membrane protein n=1 Tax=Bradyrhizobium sp. TaxID=376 RepID=UPI002B638F8A|nr:DUF2892 domain-containing protein [Bradyrhizobium sp.]HMM90353.1 DUF2892 domain-containing protein [Bradyrhizobium sp.]